VREAELREGETPFWRETKTVNRQQLLTGVLNPESQWEGFFRKGKDQKDAPNAKKVGSGLETQGKEA